MAVYQAIFDDDIDPCFQLTVSHDDTCVTLTLNNNHQTFRVPATEAQELADAIRAMTGRTRP